MQLPFFGGWSARVRRVRRKWDRTREKVLRKKPEKKQELLEKLDQIEAGLRMLEEKELTRTDRYRVLKEVEVGLEEVISVLNPRDDDDK